MPLLTGFMVWRIGFVGTLQLLFTYVPFMNRLFGTEALDATAWLYCLGGGLAIFVLVEIEKLAVRSLLSGGKAQ